MKSFVKGLRSIVSGIIDTGAVRRALGSEKSQALPVFHTFTGDDNIGETNWFQQYMEADVESPTEMMNLPEEGDLMQIVKTN